MIAGLIVAYTLMYLWSGRRIAWYMTHDEDTGELSDEHASMSSVFLSYFLALFWPVVWTLEGIDQATRKEGGIAQRIVMSEPKKMKAKRLNSGQD